MRRRPDTASLLVIAGLALFLFIVGMLGWLDPVRNLALRVFSPVASFLYRSGGIFRDTEIGAKSPSELAAEVEALRSENRQLIADQANASGVLAENERLRQYLNFTKARPGEYLMADVIARGRAADTWQSQQTLSINRGARDGLKPGMAVVDSQGILLGRLTKVTDSGAQACLLFDADCRLAVGIEGQAGTIGVIQSDLNLTVKVDFIGQNKKVSEGQTVVTSGLEDNLPANLVVGKITAVIRQGNELWQHAIVQPIANFDDIKTVAIIK